MARTCVTSRTFMAAGCPVFRCSPYQRWRWNRLDSREQITDWFTQISCHRMAKLQFILTSSCKIYRTPFKIYSRYWRVCPDPMRSSQHQRSSRLAPPTFPNPIIPCTLRHRYQCLWQILARRGLPVATCMHGRGDINCSPSAHPCLLKMYAQKNENAKHRRKNGYTQTNTEYANDRTRTCAHIQTYIYTHTGKVRRSQLLSIWELMNFPWPIILVDVWIDRMYEQT